MSQSYNLNKAMPLECVGMPKLFNFLKFNFVHPIKLNIFISIHLSASALNNYCTHDLFFIFPCFAESHLFQMLRSRLGKRYSSQHRTCNRHLAKKKNVCEFVCFSKDNEQKDLKSAQMFSGKMYLNRAKRNCMLHAFNLLLKYLQIQATSVPLDRDLLGVLITLESLDFKSLYLRIQYF